jgi:hypothetical protein
MNYWAAMLADAPALLQRLIARTQRVSLPRGCDAAERVARLRAALCRRAAVCAVYAGLDEPTQAALQELRTRRGGVSPAELCSRYGPVRPLRTLALDPRPRSVAEQLLLRGLLLPRPARPHHPARYLLPPEVRAWLPQPLVIADCGPAPLTTPLPPVLRAMAALLLAAAERPLPACRNGALRRRTLAMLAARLSPYDTAQAAALCAFTLPLAAQLGLLLRGNDCWRLAPAAAPFLDLPPAQQLARLQNAWRRSPQSEHWLAQTGAASAGIDWMYLRARLWDWAMSLPAGRLIDVRPLYQQLAAHYGPLGDAQTHGFRPVARAPWQPRRAQAVFEAALHGPLTWLGAVTLADTHSVYRGRPQEAAARQPWRYGLPGELHVAHTSIDAALLRLLPCMAWYSADSSEFVLRLRPHTTAHNAHAVLALVERCAGPAPHGWAEQGGPGSPALRLASGVLVLDEDGTTLAHAARHRSVRRYLGKRLARGVALVQPQQAARLSRILAREGIALAGAERVAPGQQQAVPGLSPGDAATLLVACALARTGPPAAPFLPDQALEARLWSMLPREQRQTTAEAIERLCASSPALETTHREAPIAPAEAAARDTHPTPRREEVLARLRHAIRLGSFVRLSYAAGEEGRRSERTIRPLALERAGTTWYLNAYCSLRRAERQFRLDRILALEPVPKAEG